MKIRVACFSDTHCLHDHIILPECDIAIFAGDSTDRGSQYDTFNFLDWFNKQSQATYKVMIAGNHEVAWDANKYKHGAQPEWTTKSYFELTYPNIRYLENSFASLFGLNIWGTPVTPDFFPEYWGFNKTRGEVIRAEWQKIPNNTDILISHGPMAGVLDSIPHQVSFGPYPGGSVGCVDLRDRVYQLPQLKLMVVGHIHENTAERDLYIGNRKLKYINAACVDNRYNFRYQPQLVELEV